MSEPSSTPDFSLTLVHVVEAAPTTYSLEAAARLARVHPDMLRYYCQLGLFGEEAAAPEAVIIFDDTMLYELRRFEHYRLQHGLNRRTLRLVCSLWREVERLQSELRFLRER